MHNVTVESRALPSEPGNKCTRSRETGDFCGSPAFEARLTNTVGGVTGSYDDQGGRRSGSEPDRMTAKPTDGSVLGDPS